MVAFDKSGLPDYDGSVRVVLKDNCIDLTQKVNIDSANGQGFGKKEIES
jgi:hypothetical protein